MGKRFKVALSALSVVMASVSVAQPAAAQIDAATARTLFDEGRKLAAKSQFEAACPKFQESYLSLDRSGNSCMT